MKLDIRVIDGKEHGEIFVGGTTGNVFSGADIKTCSVITNLFKPEFPALVC